MSIHPELQRVARVLPRQALLPVTTRFLTGLQPLAARLVPKAAETATLPSGAPVRVFRPRLTATRSPALVWIHGGGYVLGYAGMDDVTCRWYAEQLGAVVYSVDYRLAPRHPFPAALDDCYEAVRLAASDPRVDAGRVVVGGASAGGGLAAATALRARDRGEITLAAQLLLYPMLDDRTGASAASPHHRLWSSDSNAIGWRLYLGDADPEIAVPARNPDLSGLPPTWIGVGTEDLFHDEDVSYAERLTAAGVPTTLEIVPGAFHAFDRVAPKAEITRSFGRSQVEMLAAVLKPVP